MKTVWVIMYEYYDQYENTNQFIAVCATEKDANIFIGDHVSRPYLEKYEMELHTWD